MSKISKSSIKGTKDVTSITEFTKLMDSKLSSINNMSGYELSQDNNGDFDQETSLKVRESIEDGLLSFKEYCSNKFDLTNGDYIMLSCSDDSVYEELANHSSSDSRMEDKYPCLNDDEIITPELKTGFFVLNTGKAAIFNFKNPNSSSSKNRFVSFALVPKSLVED